ncbi:MAG: alpha/beta hydrolase [Planctomycetaceae bacterium]
MTLSHAARRPGLIVLTACGLGIGAGAFASRSEAADATATAPAPQAPPQPTPTAPVAPLSPAGRPAAKPAPKETVERLELTTSDGRTIAAWCYLVPEDAAPLGSVILLHDLGGSHRTVEPLAKALQAAGCIVVAPDLRGHGESGTDRERDDPAKVLKRPDFEAMAASRGGQKRDQADVVGDVESVYAWLRQRLGETQGRVPLVVVGSGLGAAVAAQWTLADARWPDTTSGPQGCDVDGLVVISPPFASKGFPMNTSLAQEPLLRSLPIVFCAGTADRDAGRVFDQMKAKRPKAWYDSRNAGSSPSKAAEATLLMLAHPAAVKADELAATRSNDPRDPAPAVVIPEFVRKLAAQAR